MKKLLLSIILLASSIAKADIAFETIHTIGNQTASHSVVLSESLSQITFELNGKTFKVVITKMAKNEEGILVVEFNFYVVQGENEALVAQPVIVGTPATLKLVDGEESVSFVINEIETTTQNVESNE